MNSTVVLKYNLVPFFLLSNSPIIKVNFSSLHENNQCNNFLTFQLQNKLSCPLQQIDTDSPQPSQRKDAAWCVPSNSLHNQCTQAGHTMTTRTNQGLSLSSLLLAPITLGQRPLTTKPHKIHCRNMNYYFMLFMYYVCVLVGYNLQKRKVNLKIITLN